MPKDIKDYKALLDSLKAQKTANTSGPPAKRYVGPGSLMKMVGRPPKEKVFYPEGEDEFEYTPRELEREAYGARERRDRLPDGGPPGLVPRAEKPFQMSIWERMREAQADQERRTMMSDPAWEHEAEREAEADLAGAPLTKGEQDQLEYLLSRAGRQ